METSVENISIFTQLIFCITLYRWYQILVHETRIVVESIRGNWHYVIWYRNLTLTSVSLLVPFVLLAYWNLNTLLVIRRRQRLRNRPYIACCETSDDPDSHNPDNSANCLSAFNGGGNRANSTVNQGIYLSPDL